MLYMIDVEIDYARMGDQRDALLAAEHAHVRNLVADGIVKVEWRKASGRGVVVIWECRDLDHLNEIIAGIPLAPYLSKTDVTALAPHPLWPDGLTYQEG